MLKKLWPAGVAFGLTFSLNGANFTDFNHQINLILAQRASLYDQATKPVTNLPLLELYLNQFYDVSWEILNQTPLNLKLFPTALEIAQPIILADPDLYPAGMPFYPPTSPTSRYTETTPGLAAGSTSTIPPQLPFIAQFYPLTITPAILSAITANYNAALNLPASTNTTHNADYGLYDYSSSTPTATAAPAPAPAPTPASTARQMINWNIIPDTGWNDQKQVGANAIYFYNAGQPYYEFTNFFPAQITIDGVTWPTSEHYFQAQKFAHNPTLQYIITQIQKTLAPRDVFNLANGRTGTYKQFIDPNWQSKSLNVMKKAVQAKINQHSNIKQLLKNTGNAILVENAGPNDAFWGNGATYPTQSNGKNWLGKILMEIRATV